MDVINALDYFNAEIPGLCFEVSISGLAKFPSSYVCATDILARSTTIEQRRTDRGGEEAQTH